MSDSPPPELNHRGIEPDDMEDVDQSLAIHALREDVRQGVQEERRRSRTVDRRLLVLFCALAAAFVFLAWRTELNAIDIREGLHDACLDRAAVAEKYNKGRDALIAVMIAEDPDAPVRTEAEMKQITQRVRDLLSLPIEECPDPEF